MDFGSGQGGGHGMIRHLGVFWHQVVLIWDQLPKEQISQAGFGESEFTLFRDTVTQIESGGEYDIQGGSGDIYVVNIRWVQLQDRMLARFLGEQYQGDDEAQERDSEKILIRNNFAVHQSPIIRL